MNASPVASIEARIASLEARFDRLGAVPAAPPSAAAVGGFEPSMRAALGVSALGEVPASSASPALDAGSISSQHAIALLSDGTTVATTGAPLPGLGGSVAPGTPFAAEFEAAGAAAGVPPKLLAAVGWVESRYQVDAVSPAGAIGVMQIMPMTATELGVDPTDPVAAIHGAARLLAAHHDRFGSWDLALAAYHSGAGAVARAGDTAPPRAADYVRRVFDRMEQA